MELQVDGRKVYAATGGRPFDPAKPVVIFIHGAGQDHTNWQLPARWFAWHGHSVLGVDLPGPWPLGRPAPGNHPRHGAMDRPPDGCRQRQASRARRALHGRLDRSGGRSRISRSHLAHRPARHCACDTGQRRPAQCRARCARDRAPDDHRLGAGPTRQDRRQPGTRPLDVRRLDGTARTQPARHAPRRLRCLQPLEIRTGRPPSAYAAQRWSCSAPTTR